MHSSIRRRFLLAPVSLLMLAALLVLLSGCAAQPQATPTPTKTPRLEAASTAPAPQAPAAPMADTPAPTPAPSATPTPLAPQAPATPEAPAPQTPATPEPTQPPTPDPNLIVPANDPGLSPFTGLRPADPAVLARRPLAIKVANQASVHPQSGLSQADVVVESRVEYSETRFTVIYQSQSVERVGSIRSARLIDVELPTIFDAVLCFSGGVQPVRQMLQNSDFGDHILEQAVNGPAFFRDPTIKAPDNLFADTATLWNTITQRGWNKPPEPSAAWAFSEAAPAGGAPASQADFPYPRFRVRWTYDAASGRWLRFMGGQPHIEKADGQQLTAANVVILGANHVITLIVEDGTERRGNPCINCSIEIQLWGEGPLKILRDGKVYEGKWLRPERHAPFRFVDAAGVDIPLKPGNSWWQVVPLDMQVTVNP